MNTKVLITGSSGLVGSALIPELEEIGYQPVKLVRSKSLASNNALFWDPENEELNNGIWPSCKSVIHLAGENIANGSWTKKKKEKILSSRIDSTRLLVDSMINADQKPESFICASAIGFYGDRGEEILTEESEPGAGFLASVCTEWEKEAQRATEAGIRVVSLRIGIVLSKDGGALQKMLPIFKSGLGGRLGSGKQYMSWIALKDLTRAILFCLKNTNISGPVNAVAPDPVSNKEFTRTLGSALKRPTFFPAPAFALKMMMGEMAEELLLASTRVKPQKLLNQNFSFSIPGLAKAFSAIL